MLQRNPPLNELAFHLGMATPVTLGNYEYVAGLADFLPGCLFKIRKFLQI